MTEIVKAGKTFALHGTLAPQDALIAHSGSPSYLTGAYVAVHTTALNQGRIYLHGGPGYPGVEGVTGATLRVTGELTNSGMITANGGSDAYQGRDAVSGAAAKIAHTGTLLNTGTVLIEGARGLPDYQGTTTGALLRDNGTLTNTGSLQIGGSVVLGHDASATAVVAGLLTNDAVIDVAAGMAAYHSSQQYGGRGGILRVNTTGIVFNNGQIVLGPSLPGATGPKAVQPPGAATLQIAGQFTNNGLVDLDEGGGPKTRWFQGSHAVITSTGTLYNAGTITLSEGFRHSADYPGFGGSAASLVNDGVLTNVGTINLGGPCLDNGLLTNDGTIAVAGGTGYFFDYEFPAHLDVAGALVNAGTLTFAAGNPQRYGYGPVGANLTDTGTVDNTGLITFYGATNDDGSTATGATFAVSGVLTNAGTVLLGGGSAVYNANAPGATLSDSGTIDNTGVIILQGAAAHDGGTVTGATLTVSGVLTNAGRIEVSTGADASSATVQISGTLTNIGRIACYGPTHHGHSTNGAGGLITVSGMLIDPGAITGTGVLDNAGIVYSGAAGVVTGRIDTTVVNTGTIEIAADGAFAISGSISGSGQISLATGGVLTLGTTVGYGQTVDFAGTYATLALVDPAAFYATIEGLRPQTTIDFVDTAITSAQAIGTTLALGLAAGGTLDFTLAAPLASYATLSLTSDLHGGTDLVVLDNSADLPGGLLSPGLTFSGHADLAGNSIDCARGSGLLLDHAVF